MCPPDLYPSAHRTTQMLSDAINRGADVHDDLYREFEFSEQDFSRVRSMIIKAAGISLAASKQSMVYSRLVRRLRACGMNKFSTYLDTLEKNASNPEWEHFINALTTNLTSFYREAHHFEILKKQLQAFPSSKRVELWCSASSTGEEPYSMAMTAMEAYQSLTPPVRILATDIDTKVLAQAKRGVYQTDQIDKVPSECLKKYFTKVPNSETGEFAVRPEVQALVSFRQLNLIEPHWNIRQGFDAIFCRNVMIYFEKDLQLEILKRFAALMNPGGLLYAGHSESFSAAHDYFTLQGKTVYVVHQAQRKTVTQA
jgi:chemotaxis protein methyltransferase CheR